MMYGYVEPGLVESRGRQRHLNVSRLMARPTSTRNPTSVSNVLVIWVATRKNGRSPEMVGWYENATVYGAAQTPPGESVRHLPGHTGPGEYFASARAEDCVLVPSESRSLELPRKGEGLGHSNVWYAEDDRGRLIKEDVIRFIRQWKNSHGANPERRYYVLGSKYDESPNKWSDKLPEMRAKNAVAVGWAGDYNLEEYYGKPEADIIAYLQSRNEGRASYNTLRLFLNLKPGDLIAVKGSGSPKGRTPYLSIHAYAVVVERGGRVYSHDPDGLGHLVNVEFIEGSSLIELPVGGYGRTLQRVTNEEHIKAIFGYYGQTVTNSGGKQGTTDKNTDPYYRSGAAGRIAERAHNKLQQEVYEWLVSRYGVNAIAMEKNNIDLIRVQGNETTLYEVKAYNSAKQCVREALGQIVGYSWFNSQNASTAKLAVVGPRKADTEESKYITYVKSLLRKSFDYVDFETGELREN